MEPTTSILVISCVVSFLFGFRVGCTLVMDRYKKFISKLESELKKEDSETLLKAVNKIKDIWK